MILIVWTDSRSTPDLIVWTDSRRGTPDLIVWTDSRRGTPDLIVWGATGPQDAWGILSVHQEFEGHIESRCHIFLLARLSY